MDQHPTGLPEVIADDCDPDGVAKLDRDLRPLDEVVLDQIIAAAGVAVPQISPARIKARTLPELHGLAVALEAIAADDVGLAVLDRDADVVVGQAVLEQQALERVTAPE